MVDSQPRLPRLSWRHQGLHNARRYCWSVGARRIDVIRSKPPSSSPLVDTLRRCYPEGEFFEVGPGAVQLISGVPDPPNPAVCVTTYGADGQLYGTVVGIATEGRVIVRGTRGDSARFSGRWGVEELATTCANGHLPLIRVSRRRVRIYCPERWCWHRPPVVARSLREAVAAWGRWGASAANAASANVGLTHPIQPG